MFLDKSQRPWTAVTNTSPDVSEDGRSFRSGDDMSGKRSNSSNERTNSRRSVSKGRNYKSSNGRTGSKGSLISKADAENECGEENEKASKLHTKEHHQNTTLQLIKKGRKIFSSLDTNILSSYITINEIKSNFQILLKLLKT